jgi:hypothetical protein
MGTTIVHVEMSNYEVLCFGIGSLGECYHEWIWTV